MTRVYKIVQASAWVAAIKAGAFGGAEVDLKDGYIHLSTGPQAAQTARLHFAGRDGLVIVAFEAEALGGALRWEPSRGGDPFPHLYGPLDPALAVETRPLNLNTDGWPDPGSLSA
jgi:uncharacterized protein (DUF952 family)